MTESLKDRYAIAGIGQSRIGKVPELDDYGLQLTAVTNALDDAGLKKRDIDGLITHSHLLGAVTNPYVPVTRRSCTALSPNLVRTALKATTRLRHHRTSRGGLLVEMAHRKLGAAHPIGARGRGRRS